MNSLIPARYASLLDLLQYRASPESGTAHNTAFTFLEDGEQVSGVLTFLELDRQARSIAAHLQARTAPGDRVMLVYPPGLDYIAAFFGCVYAGVIAVPALPPANARTLPRLQLMAADAAPRLALTLGAIAARIGQWQVGPPQGLGALDWLAGDTLADAASQWRRPAVQPSDIAFLQYTSGSTGTPKGVMVSHANILANAALIHASFALQPSETVVSWLPPHHDMGLIGKILYPVYAGCHCVQFPPAAFLLRPYRWLKALSDYRARITAAPNFAYELCVSRVSEEQKLTLDLSALAFALNGAEPIRADTLRRFADAFAPCGLRADALTPVYGLAETTLLVTVSRPHAPGLAPATLLVSKAALARNAIDRAADEAHAAELVSCGMAGSAGHDVAIVNPASLTPLGMDAVGEVWVAGASVAQGYWQRPDETAQAFGASPAGMQARYLRTGDLGFIHDGQLYITGRIKEMLILNGRNIYPQDIEAMIERLDPAFRANGCAVFTLDDGPSSQLVVVQEVESRKDPATAQLAGAVRAELAELFGIVDLAAIVLVKAGRIPRTSSGKLQRLRCRAMFVADEFSALWQWRDSRPSAPREASATGLKRVMQDRKNKNVAAYKKAVAAFVPPQTDTERALALIWGEFLGIKEISSNDNFFSLLGGHSLSATQVIAQLREAFQVELPLRTIYDAATLAELARQIDLARQSQAGTASAAITPLTGGAPRSLSFAQQRLWFLDQLEPGSANYNIPVAVRLSGQLDASAFARSITEIVRRHQALRTSFSIVDGEPLQVIGAAADVALPLADLSGLAHGERAARAVQLASEEAQAPFDLATGPLIRSRLLRLEPGEHIALLTIHHIVSDGWSMGVLVRELAALYGAYVQALPSPLPELAIQYADFAHWQRQWLTGAVLDTQLAYWKTRLAGAAPLLNLPTDRARPAVQTHRGATWRFSVGADTTAGLLALGKQTQATLFMTLAAAFNVLLARYSGQDDICIGTPIANRKRAETEDLIGFFVNTLVLRTRLGGNPAFIDLLAQVREHAVAAYAHQDVPFEQLVEALKPERHLGHAPLFQVMLALQNAPLERLALPGLALELIEADRVNAKFDLTLEVTEVAGQLHALFDYNTDLFDASTIERMAGHFGRLLEAVVQDPLCRVAELPMLGNEERARMLFDWNDSAAEFPHEQTIGALFEAQVLRTPDQTALRCGDEELSYSALNARANRLARHLRTRGVGPDVLVGLRLERSIDMVVALLAILKAGGAYLPLDPAYPEERLSAMLADARPLLVLSGAELRAAMTAAYASDNLEPLGSPDNLAYVNYTSGSTGKPKGVAISHRAVNRLVFDARYLDLRPSDSVAQAASFSFDALTFELWGALLHGCRLCILERDTILSPGALAAEIRRLNITVLFLTTALFNQSAAQAPGGFAGLRHLLFGGEQVDPRAVAAVLRHGAPQRLLHVYGPTESTTFALWHLVEQVAGGAATIPIGKPLANTQAYLLDAGLEPVPVGAAGELYIGGDGLARGYLGDPALTAEKFIPNPFAALPGARMYRSGDLARHRGDGAIEFVGRIDDQLKMRGFRIEPGEIEAALCALPQVREAFVLAREDIPGDKRLVAYLVRRGDQADLEGLAAALATALPDYMVPAHFVAVERLPLGANGKVDRQALPAPDMRRGQAGYTAPRSATEVALAAIWCGVLGLDRVGIDDNFFALGGHSLLATRVASSVRTALRRELPLRALFEAPTVALLARRIDLLGSNPGAPDMVALDRGTALPLSYAQQRLWFLDQFQPGSVSYNIPLAFRLLGPLDAAALSRALNQIVRRHETLRTTFAMTDGVPAQVIAPAHELAMPLVDLAALPHGEREARAQWLANDEAQTPFDLACGPLLRSRLLHMADSEHIILLTMHHIVSDGWSMDVLVRELGALYGAGAGAAPSPSLPPLAVQYADFAQWQRAWLSGTVLQQQLDYWSAVLADAPALLALPTDRPRPPVQTRNGALLRFSVGPAITAGLLAIGRRTHSTLFMTLTAAFSVLLARHSGQDDICIGTPIANRNRSETEGLIGLFINTLVLRTKIDGNPAFSALLARVRDAALGAYAHQDLPFELLVDAVKPERNLSYSPLFQVMLALQNAPTASMTLPGLRIEPVAADHASAKFDLTLNVSEEAGALACYFEYNTDLFDASTIARMARHLTALFEAIVQDPECRIADLAMLGAGERAQLLHDWNDSAADYPRAIALHQMVEAQAARAPDRVALVFGDTALSYAELNARANRLARHLRSLGVGPEVLVAIGMERTPAMLVGLLAILKAGGAYVPLDPGYPAERLAYVLADARPAVLLTEQRVRARLPAGLCTVCCLDAERDTVAAYPAANLASTALPGSLAYVIYTSGSTGKPKGVGISRQSLANFIHAMQGAPGIAEDDVLLSVTSLSFDIAALELFLPLASGACTVLASRAAGTDPRQLHALIARHGVTIMQATPSTWRMLADHAWPRHARPLTLLCGGEALPAGLVHELLQHVPALWNMYGPTETTIWSALHRITPAQARPAIGRPIANTRIYILDRHLAPVPVGVAGELYIAGDGLARGYLNRADLTAAGFIPAPFGGSGARMYRTGDLARYLPDGCIDYLGRADDQVKIRGFRIELGEIESTLAALPSVREAVVLAHTDAGPGALPGESRLIAYVVPQHDAARANAQAGPGDAAFSLFYFGSDSYAQDNKYRLYLESAKFADQHGFEAIWTPERHFHEVGSLYPNPAILNAALATITSRVKLRAGSVVLPLHDPIRVAEEWAVVDNLSNGRAGVAIASGWHPRDFALAPEKYASRKQDMLDGIDTLNTLWRGATVTRTDGTGNPVAVAIFPKPVQASLPMWVTAAGNPDTFIQAGRLGMNVLTHMLSQSVPELAAQIQRYRAARLEHGHDPAGGKVTVMVHAFVGADLEATIEQARVPFLNYMRSHLGLMESLVKSLELAPEYANHKTQEEIISFAFERYTKTASLIGTAQSCLQLVTELQAIGVDEIACLVDWMDTDKALLGLPALAGLMQLARSQRPSAHALRAQLKTSLPDYMVPSHFILLDQWPLTPNGKLDRRALPAPQRDCGAHGYVAPRTAQEQRIARVWAEVLQREQVGIHDNFFELGGNSLLAVTLNERMRKTGLMVDVRTLFASPTIAAMALAIQSEAKALAIPPNLIPPHGQVITPAMVTMLHLTPEHIGTICAATPGGAGNIQDIYPLAPLQEGILFHHMLNEDGDVYLLSTLLAFDSRARLDRFCAALQSVIDRHDILRTAVLWEGLPEPVQVVWREAPISIEELRLNDSDGDLAGQLKRRHDPHHYRVDVRQAPLLRAFIAADAANGRWLLHILAHHLAIDHTTMELLIGEIAAIQQGRQDTLAPTLPFRNYVAQTRLGVSQAEHEAFFTAMLSDVDQPTTPFGLLDVQGDGADIDEARMSVAPALARRLRRQARSAGASPATLMHVAWGQLLAALSGRADVVFGTVLFGRMEGGAGAERVLGMFINTLPLRIRIDGASVVQVVRAVHRQLTELLRHEHAPLALAQRCSAVSAPLPLFSSLLNYRYSAIVESDISARASQAWEGMQLLGVQERSNYPFCMSVDDLGEQFTLMAHVGAGIPAQRICEYMHTLLEALVEALETAPDMLLGQLDMLPPAERSRQLLEWNDSAVDYRQDQMVHGLFEAQAELTPHASALVCGALTLSYAELDAQANRLARHLRSLGVGPEVLVGICVERSPAMIVALLAILKAGGAYLPLDPTYPAERLAYMLADAAPALLLTQSQLLDAVGAAGLPTYCIDGPAPAPAAGKAQDDAQNDACNAVRHGSPANLAYVIYTSGSSGKPKGVLLTHHALCNLVHAQADAFGMRSGQRLLQFASLNFDAATWEIFMALTSGATLCLAEPERLMPGLTLEATLQELAISTATLPPVALGLLSPSALPLLTTVIVAGEAFPAALAQAWSAQRALFNAYGPTEATVCATIHRCGAGAPARPPIGRPMANVRVYLLDTHLNPVPTGVAGELYIAGHGLARGYLKRAGLTAASFVPDPFSATGGARMYRSGDLARYLPDGSIDYLGRVDDQLKIRGIRIEPGEIAAALTALPGVRDAVVLMREDSPGDQRLVAYVVPQDAAHQIEPAALRAALAGCLPDYMVPAHVLVMERFPLTANGKLDRKALAAPDTARDGTDYVGPRTPTEAVLAGVWGAILGLQRVGIYDNFFTLGGHSLLAGQASLRAQQQLGVSLSLRAFYATPTIAQLADQYDELLLCIAPCAPNGDDANVEEIEF